MNAPQFKRDMKKEDQYLRKTNQQLRWIMLKKRLTPKLFISVLLIIALLSSVMVTVLFVQKEQDTRSKATADTLQVSLYPKYLTVNTNEEFSLTAKLSGALSKKVSSVELSIRFDNSKINFKSVDRTKPADTASMLFLKSTAPEKANSTGTVKILYGVASKETALTGVINLPKITFVSIVTGEGNLAVNAADTKIVFLDKTTSPVIQDNPVSIIVAVPTPSSNPTPTQKAEPSQKLSPTVNPSVTHIRTPGLFASPSVTVPPSAIPLLTPTSSATHISVSPTPVQ